MTTSINANGNESLAMLLQKLNALDTNNSKGVSKGELNALETETQFSSALNALFEETDVDSNGEITESELVKNKGNILGQIGAPATFGLEASSSVLSRLRNMNVVKALDVNKDNRINVEDFNAAKEKSPLVNNLVNAYKNAGSENKVGNFINNLVGQYASNPLNILEDVAEVFA